MVEEDDLRDRHLDAHRFHEVLGARSAPPGCFTLRYLDALPVPEVAEPLGRSTTATEALLVRAKAAFRRAYDGGDDARGRGSVPLARAADRTDRPERRASPPSCAPASSGPRPLARAGRLHRHHAVPRGADAWAAMRFYEEVFGARCRASRS